MVDMDPVDNPYNPGAGTPPPELAGRESILKQAENTIKRTKKGKIKRSRAFRGHLKTKKSNKRKRHARGKRLVSKSDEKKMKRQMPYW